MSTRFPNLSPPAYAPLRLVHPARPSRIPWAGCLPIGELLVMAAFGLVLVLA
ncbi:hypothetical protein [Tabrizicola piscis]|uniref:hypothetical protein n=1 Tax=Tabrizicola piscis TaxID=2494374 RepID=UPI0013DDA52F|nr:hypothetical protein [Tabrizicola piscis]